MFVCIHFCLLFVFYRTDCFFVCYPEFNTETNQFVNVQSLPTQGAKGVEHFLREGVHYLAVANSVRKYYARRDTEYDHEALDGCYSSYWQNLQVGSTTVPHRCKSKSICPADKAVTWIVTTSNLYIPITKGMIVVQNCPGGSNGYELVGLVAQNAGAEGPTDNYYEFQRTPLLNGGAQGSQTIYIESSKEVHICTNASLLINTGNGISGDDIPRYHMMLHVDSFLTAEPSIPCPYTTDIDCALTTDGAGGKDGKCGENLNM